VHGPQDGLRVLRGHPRYEVLEELGHGAFGNVYRARDNVRGIEVALKTLREKGAAGLRELKLEFRARVDLHHETLLQLFEIDAEGDEPFITMELVPDALSCVEFVRGETPGGAPLSGTRALDRLTRALYSCLSALTCLHESGFVHRDIKPSNILASARDNRVRVSDFGLVARAGERSGEAFAGTYGYIAPEVLLGGAPSPESDLFSVGVVALEALTGKPPSRLGPRESDIAQLPAGPLADFVRGLIRRNTDERIDARRAAELLIAVRSVSGLTTQALAPLRVVKRPVFVGRRAELERAIPVLSRESSAPSIISVTGPAGIGKSAFIERLLREAAPIGAHVIRGRCHPQENLAFRAWDEVAEQLVAPLDRISAVPDATEFELSALARLLPPLAAAYPVDLASPSVAPASEVRNAGSRGLRAVIRTLAIEAPLVVWIDDLHWADPDSRALLTDLVESPAENVTLVLSQREYDGAELGVLAPGLAVEPPGWSCLRLPLGPLSETEVFALLASADMSSEELPKEAREALARLPMFVADAAAIAARRGPQQLDALVSQLIAQRVKTVSEEHLDVLRTVAASPRPLPWSVLESAVAEREGLYASYQALRQAGLLSPVATAVGEAVWTYHEIIRAAQVEAFSRDDHRVLHGALAEAYEARAPREFESIAHHCEHAGRLDDAASSLVRAADRSLESLSFGVAASHYEHAFELSPPLTGRWELQRKRAECDASRGLASLAGARFAKAASLLEEQDGATTAVALRARAAREWILCGETADGYRQLRQAAGHLGIKLPGSHRQTMASSIWLRLRFVVWPGRGVAAASPTPAELERLDALWAGCSALSHINHSLADVLLLRHLLLAGRVNDPARLMRSLAFEAGAEATIGGKLFNRRSQELLERARELCETLDDDYEWGWYWVSRAAVSAFGCDWAATVEAANTADSFLARREYGVAWERSVNRIYRAIAQSMMGRVDALRDTVAAGRADAAERGDAVALNGVTSGHPAILRLFDDVPGVGEEAPVHKPSAERSWPELAFTSPDYYDTIAEAERRLYLGDGAGGLRALDAAWPEFKRSALVRLAFVGIDARYLRGRCALQAATAATDAKEYERLVRVARSERATLSKSVEPLGKPYATALTAGLASLQEPASAGETYASAAGLFDDLSMQAHAAAARLWATESQNACAQAEAELKKLGAKNPHRLAALLIPAPPPR